MIDDLDDALEDDLTDVYDRATDPDDAAGALRVLVRARRILKDSALMARVGKLMNEQRSAVRAAKEE